jgi:hypothetical protein
LFCYDFASVNFAELFGGESRNLYLTQYFVRQSRNLSNRISSKNSLLFGFVFILLQLIWQNFLAANHAKNGN